VAEGTLAIRTPTIGTQVGEVDIHRHSGIRYAATDICIRPAQANAAPTAASSAALATSPIIAVAGDKLPSVSRAIASPSDLEIRGDVVEEVQRVRTFPRLRCLEVPSMQEFAIWLHVADHSDGLEWEYGLRLAARPEQFPTLGRATRLVTAQLGRGPGRLVLWHVICWCLVRSLGGEDHEVRTVSAAIVGALVPIVVAEGTLAIRTPTIGTQVGEVDIHRHSGIRYAATDICIRPAQANAAPTAASSAALATSPIIAVAGDKLPSVSRAIASPSDLEIRGDVVEEVQRVRTFPRLRCLEVPSMQEFAIWLHVADHSDGLEWEYGLRLAACPEQLPTLGQAILLVTAQLGPALGWSRGRRLRTFATFLLGAAIAQQTRRALLEFATPRASKIHWAMPRLTVACAS